MKRRGFFQALAAIFAAPVVPLEELAAEPEALKVLPLAPIKEVPPLTRIYCCNQPILFLPGMKFDIEFEA